MLITSRYPLGDYIPTAVSLINFDGVVPASADCPASLAVTRPLTSSLVAGATSTADLTVGPLGGGSATLGTQAISAEGLLPSYQAAAVGGDTLVADSTSFLHIKNGGGVSMQVTLITPATVDTVLPVDDRVVTVGASSERMIAVPDNLYENPTTGRAVITYSSVTAVTVAAFRR